MGRIVLTIFIIAALLTGCSIMRTDKIGINEGINDKEIIVKMIDVKSAKEDFESLKDNYSLLHPAFKHDADVQKSFEKKYYEVLASISKPIGSVEMYIKLSQLINVLNDGHAMIQYIGDSTDYLPLQLRWVEEGLIVEGSQAEGVAIGDKIVKVKGRNIQDLLLDFDTIISAENIHWVKHRSSQLITTKYVLDGLRLINNDGTVTIEVEELNGTKKEISVPFVKESITSKKVKDFSFDIYEPYDIAIFTLNRCVYNSVYIEALKNFFKKVHEKDIKKIVVDLRENSGGNSMVLNEFLSYIDITNYDVYYNAEKTKSTEMNKRKEENLFNGSIYVATSNKTFSSAVLFAGVIKYNNIGITIGEPIGNATIRYGMSNEFELPNTKMKYIVSSKKWILPNTVYKPTIEPDIYIPLTRQDIVDNTDPLIKWIKKL